MRLTANKIAAPSAIAAARVIQRERMLDPQGEQLDPENLDETRAGLLQDLKLVQYDFSIGERYVVDEMWPGAVQRE